MKKNLLLILGCLFLMTGLLGCGDKKSGKVDIRYWVWLDNPNDPTLADMVAQYNQENPNVNVIMEVIPWGDYRNKLLTSAINGDAPDVAAFKLAWKPEFSANNYLATLDKHINKWNGKADISTNLWDIMKDEKNNIIAMPWEIQVLYMYYRPSLFKKAGVEIPQTWDEFLEASKRLTGNGQYAYTMRGARYGHEPWGSFVFSGVEGNKIMEDNKVVFDTPEARKMNQLFVDLFKVYKVVPPTSPTDGFAQIIQNFQTGKAAMVIHHIKSSPKMIETFGDDVDAFPVPAGRYGRWTSMGDTENVMFDSSANKEEAFKFMAWLSEKNQVDKWCRAAGNVPVTTSLWEDPYYKENRFMKASFESLPYANIYPVNKNTGEWIELVWPTTIQRALLGEITADAAFDTLVQEMQKP